MRGLRIYTRTFLPEDVGEGDVAWRSQDEEFVDLRESWTDDEDEHVELAERTATELRDRGLTEYSASDFQGARGWYSLADGSQPSGPDGNYTGLREEVSGHLEDFTDAQALEVWRLVTGGR
jgi:hypothetical protein